VSAWISFGAALSYFFIVFFIENPATRRWRRDHEWEPVPAEVWSAAEKQGPYVLLVQLVVLGGVVELLRAGDVELAVPFLSSGMPLWRCLVFGAPLGLVLGSLRSIGGMWISSRERYRVRPRRIPAFFANFPWNKMEVYFFGRPVLWITIFVVGGFAEEHWRALTLRAFERAGWDPVFPVLLTSLVFGFAYGAGHPARGGPGLFSHISSAAWGALMAVVFLGTGSWGIPCVANIVCNLSDWLIQRKAMTRAEPDTG
jgi:hypothetical protein